jgi:hypothetical protein
MNHLIIAYAVVVTIFLATLYRSYGRLHNDYIHEQEHSADLRRTILKYLRDKNVK